MGSFPSVLLIVTVLFVLIFALLCQLKFCFILFYILSYKPVYFLMSEISRIYPNERVEKHGGREEEQTITWIY